MERAEFTDAFDSYVSQILFGICSTGANMSLAGTCKAMNSHYKLHRSRSVNGVIVTVLRDEQKDAIEWIGSILRSPFNKLKDIDRWTQKQKDQMEICHDARQTDVVPHVIFLQAYPSFGKTVVAIASIVKYLRDHLDHHALVICPPSILGTWEIEIAKHAPSLVEDIVIFHGSGAIRRRVENGETPLKGKIILITPKLFESTRWLALDALTVFDEAHRTAKNIFMSTKLPVDLQGPYRREKFMREAGLTNKTLKGQNLKDAYRNVMGHPPDKSVIFPAVFLSASSFNYKYITHSRLYNATENALNDVDLQVIDVDSNKGSGYTEDIVCDSWKLISPPKMKRADTHVILLGDWFNMTSTTRADIIKRIAKTTGLKVIPYLSSSERKQSTLDLFEEKGGVLLSRVSLIAEGKNLNRCSFMVIVYAGCEALATIQQCVHRVCRSSNIYAKVKVTYCVRKVQDHIYAKLSVFPTFGLCRKEGAKIDYILRMLETRKIDPRKLCLNDLFHIFVRVDVKSLDDDTEIQVPNFPDEPDKPRLPDSLVRKMMLI